MSAPSLQSTDPLSSAAPTAAGLDTYAAQVQEIVLYLRDEGHVLSPIDQHLVECWWEAGYPLDVVLRTLWTQGRKLKARKKPPRGLPLRSMNRQVERAGVAALRARVGGHSNELYGDSAPGSSGDAAPRASSVRSEADEARDLLCQLLDDVAGRLRELEGDDSCAVLLANSRSQLERLGGENIPVPQMLSALLQVGREYYDALWNRLSVAEQSTLRSDVLDGLGQSVARMSPDALEETVSELCRRRLRARDPLFEPQRYWRME